MKRAAVLVLVLSLAAPLAALAAADNPPAAAVEPKPDEPKPATDFTKQAQRKVYLTLPFSNFQDFNDANRGFVALLDPTVIPGAPGMPPIWDLKAYTQFVSVDRLAPDTVNPSLWRQLQLLTITGLFAVTDRIYQVRGGDLSNMTIVEGDTGVIVIDPMISAETARAGLALYFSKRPRKPVAAVIFTHSHIDHYGGIKGVVTDEDLAARRVQIIAPDGFFEESVSENVIAGTAMGRRAQYMYGSLLPKGPRGQVGAGLGLTTSAGTSALVKPTKTITHTGEEMTIAGVPMIFQLTPGTEAPAEMNFYFPEFKALCMAENLNATFHNVLTLRGAKVRDPLIWSHYLQEAIDLFARRSNVVFGSHHWPRWGQAAVLNYMSKQRDLYKYINDQAVRLFNQGYTMSEVAEQIQLPPSLGQEWFNRDYYGTVNHNAKAVYQRYLGWFDGNPAHLYGYPPEEAGKRYVQFMGGPDEVIKNARESYAKGDYRWVAEVVSHLVFAYPDNTAARYLEADALEQLGYQAESGPWRNFFLTGAQELRKGVKKPPQTASNVGPDTAKAMDVELLLDYMAVHLNGPRAATSKGRYDFTFTDANETWRIDLDNAVLQYHAINGQAEPFAADARLTLTKVTLNDVVGGQKTFAQAVQENAVQVTGNSAKATELFALMDPFDSWFNIVTP